MQYLDQILKTFSGGATPELPQREGTPPPASSLSSCPCFLILQYFRRSAATDSSWLFLVSLSQWAYQSSSSSHRYLPFRF